MAICKEIDDMTLHLLQLMNELVSCKVQIENATTDGFMYMAKSRILLGKERVSILQCPLNSDEDIPSLFAVSRENSGENEFSLIENSFKACLKFEDAEEKISVSSNSDKDMKLTRRTNENINHGVKSSDDKELIVNEGVIKPETVKEKKYVDPLNWFGVLVPQELKMAQKAFKKAVSLTVNCANIQCKIEDVMEKLENAKSDVQ